MISNISWVTVKDNETIIPRQNREKNERILPQFVKNRLLQTQLLWKILKKNLFCRPLTLLQKDSIMGVFQWPSQIFQNMM